MAKLRVEVVTGERLVYTQDEVDMVVAPGADGVLGILPRHAPLITILASGDVVKARGLKPSARIVGWGGHAQAPEWFTTAPVGAIKAALAKTGLSIGDIDLFEINEAFAVVAMVTAKECGIPEEKINVRGGAIAIGHPIGASGARILTTLIYAMRRRDARRGIAALCLGGGNGVALAIER